MLRLRYHQLPVRPRSTAVHGLPHAGRPVATPCLRNHILPAVRAASAHHLCHLSATTSSTTSSASPARFAAEEYLVATCGLTPAQALKASKVLSHVQSPAKPDAVLAFLAAAGIARADIAAAVARYPQLLCYKLDKTLAPRYTQLLDTGLSPPQIARLITIVPNIFINPCKISRLPFYLSFLGSYDQLHMSLKRCPYVLAQDLETVVKPNIAILQECGLAACEIAEFSKLLSMKPELVRETVARAEKLGVSRNTRMFKCTLWAVSCASPETVSAKMDFLKTTFGCSEDELALVVRKAPQVLRVSDSKLSRAIEFLKAEVGLQPQYIVRRPTILSYSLQRRLMPRHYVIKVLKAKGLVKKEIDFYSAICLSEKSFVQRFLAHYKESVPGLADAYTTACAEK